MAQNKNYIRDLSQKEIAVLIDECFYIIGKKTDNLEKFHIDTMINGIYKYQGSMLIDGFKEAFTDYAAGELEVELNSGAAPVAIGKLIKAYKVKKFGTPVKRNDYSNNENESKWVNFIKFIMRYGHIPDGSDWVSLWNYCYSKGWFTGEGLTPILEWNTARYKLAQQEVKDLVEVNMSQYLHGNNVFTGKRGPGNLNIGTRLKQSLTV